MSDLFRKEVLEKQGQKLFGDVILASPISHKAMTALLAVIIFGLVTFSIIGEYSRKERVLGYLTPDTGLIRILPRQAGIIDEIHIEAGETVKKGQALFKIKLDTASEDGQQTAQSLLLQLEEERQDLEDRLKLVPKQYGLSRRRLSEQIKATKDEADQLSQRIELQERSVTIEREVLEKYNQLLDSEAASSLEASSQENRYLQASQTLQSLKASQQRLYAQSDDYKAQYRMLPITEQQEVNDAKVRLGAVTQKIIQAKSQETYIVTAPVDGRMSSVTGRRGQLADGQKALASILPIDGKMEAELLVPTRAAGFVEEGQTVRLLYDAFPYQKFGFHSGTITQVSKTILIPSDIPIAPLTQEPVFLVTVTLDNQAVLARGEDYPLQAGMTLAADIVLEDRKIWEWAFEPILGAMQ